MPVAIALAGVLLSGWSAMQVQERSDLAAQAEFSRLTQSLSTDVVRRFTVPLYGLRGAKGTYAASAHVGRDGFRVHVAALDLAHEFPGVRGFGFIERVPRVEEARFVQAARDDGAPDFRIRELAPGVGADRYVIKYIEPLALNQPALGLDVGSEANRRAAIERAIDSGRPALTDPIVLVQDGRRSPGFLLYLPAYRSGAATDTPAARRDALLGVLYAPIVAAELLSGARQATAGQLAFKLDFVAAGAPPELVYDSLADAGPVADAASASTAPAPGFEASVPLDIVGSRFTLSSRATPAFAASLSPATGAWVGGAGLLLTAFLAYLVHLLAGGRRRAEAIALGLTAELDRLAMVARHTSNAVVITDAQRRISWVNDGFERLTGHRLEEVRGQSPGRLLQCEDTDAATVAQMRDALGAGNAFRGELLNVAKDGRRYWLELEIQPLHDVAGGLTGFMAIETDISERRGAEAALAAARRETDALLSTIREHAIVSMAGRDGRIIEANDAFCAISQYRREDLLGQDHRIINSGTHPPGFWAEMWRTVSSGRSWRAEVCNRARDGSLYWVDSIVAPFIGADGRVEKYVSVRTDITASKRAAQELARERARLALIIDGTGAGTWEIDFESGDDQINEAYAGMLGYSRQELSARIDGNFLGLLHQDDRDAVTEARQAHLDGLTDEYEVEFRMQHRDGHWVWVLSRGRVGLRDAQGRALRMAGIHLDITARKWAEWELARERLRLSSIVEGTNVGTWEWNVVTGEAAFNERWAEIGGWTLAELAPVSIKTWTDLCHPEDLTRSNALLQRHFDGDTDHYECEVRMRHKAGHWVWALARGRLHARSADGGARWIAGTQMDITERKLSEQALRASQALLDTTGRIASIGGWMLDLASGALTWSDQTCRIHGVPPGHRPTLEEAIGFYAPEARETMRDLVQRGIDTGEPWDEELPFVTAGGHAIWVRTMGEVEREGGRAVRLVGAFQDITERRALAEQLRRSSQVMSSIVENLPCGVSVFNDRLELVASNGKFRELLGFPDAMFGLREPRYEDFIRLNAERGEYGEGHVDEIVARTIERARLLGSQPHRFERVRPNGTPIEVQGAPMPGGGFVTTYTDISDRKRAEQEVQRSAALLRGAIEAIDEAFVLYDPDDRLVLCNERYRQTYANVAELMVPGVRFEELVREGVRRGDYLDAIGHEEEWVRERVAAHLRANSTIVQRLDNGKTLRIVERRLPDGHIVGFRIDVTELTQATEAAEQASKAKSQFLANMSHEIRTPMNAILGMLKLLRRSSLDARQDDYAAKTEGAARSLLSLLNDILDFSKAEAGKMLLDPQPFRVGAWLQDLSVILQADAEGKGIALRFDIDPAVPPALTGDSMRLQQVLLNLGGNAIKFTERGEVVVRVAVRSREQQAVRLEVSVQDTGIGIAPENHARIFSGFTQAEASTTRRFGGTGLGVAICQRLVQMMGGDLQLDSALGRGSRFWFEITLPLADEASCASTLEAPAAPGAGRLAGLRLLLAEDNANNQQVARELLEDEGAEVHIVGNGLQAVNAVARASPTFDAVLMDLQMPEMDGYTATSRIRQDLGRQVLPIVAMTANAMASDREACLAAGMNDHIGKPFDLNQLVAILRRVTRRDAAPAAASPAVLATPPLPQAQQALAAAAGVDLAAALHRMGGRVPTYRRLLGSFVRDLDLLATDLQVLRAEGRWDEAKRQAHTVKGLAGTLGAMALSQRAAAAEHALASETAVEAAAAVQAFCDEVAQARPALAQLCAGLDDGLIESTAATASGAAGAAALGDALRVLARLLSDADMDAVAALERLRQDHAVALGDRLEPLEDAVAQLDFERALVVCRAMLEASRA